MGDEIDLHAKGAGFDADWLRWREPADTQARDADLLAAWLEGLPIEARIMELGAGTGSLLRACLPRLRRSVHWQALEGDAGLIARAEARFAHWAWDHPDWTFATGDPVRLRGPGGACELHWQCIDLSADVPDLSGVTAVAASAWGDLVSWCWAGRFAAQAAAAQVHSVYLALNVVDGPQFHPALPLDGLLGRAFAAHMRRDKGLGPALGGAAAVGWALALRTAGYRLRDAASVWRLGSTHPLLTAAWLEGYVRAACEQQPGLRNRAGDWLTQRLSQLAQGALQVQVAHRDVLAWRP